jgi:hypothetical protein
VTPGVNYFGINIMKVKQFLVIPATSVFFLGLFAGCASPKHPVA